MSRAASRTEPGDPDERSPLPSHLTEGPDGPRARMVDVGAKPTSERRALARAVLRLPAGLLDGVLAGRGPKGPIEEVARVAGVLAAKRTPELIPMCHGLPLDWVDVTFRQLDACRLEVRCETATRAPTGVEMEAMTGAALAALCAYDMVKGLDKGCAIESLELLEKRGGRSGTWRRADAEPTP